MKAVAALVVVAACGRVAFDPSCPVDTTPIEPGASVCIERVERGTLPWADAATACDAVGRRLCADLEWYDACVNATGVSDMIDGGYEWVAEESDGVAQKRGSTDCTVMSTHVVTDSYEFRCCVDL